MTRKATLLASLAVLGLAPVTAHAQTAAPSVKIQSFSVIVRDYDEARTWYRDKLGFDVVTDQRFGPSERYVLVAPAGQRDLGIVLQIAKRNANAPGDDMPLDYSDHVGKTVNVVLHTSDATAYARAIESRGVTLTNQPKAMPWGTQATFRDLYGNTFVIVGPAPAR